MSGHTGFKGGWLALWLHELGAERHRLRGRRRPPSPPCSSSRGSASSSTTCAATYATAAAVQAAVAAARPEVVLHLAAQPVVRRAWREPADAFAINTLGTVHVLEAVRERAPEADRGRHHHATRSTPTRTAAAGSARTTRSAARTPTRPRRRPPSLSPRPTATRYGLRIATARAGNVIGGGDWAEDRILPDAVRAAHAGTPARRPRPGRDPPLAARPQPAERLPHAGASASRIPRSTRGVELRPAARARAAPGGVDRRPLRRRARRRSRRGRRRTTDDGPEEAARVGLDPTLADERLGWRERWALERGVAAAADWYRSVVFEGADAREVTLGPDPRLRPADRRDGSFLGQSASS